MSQPLLVRRTKDSTTTISHTSHRYAARCLGRLPILPIAVTLTSPLALSRIHSVSTTVNALTHRRRRWSRKTSLQLLCGQRVDCLFGALCTTPVADWLLSVLCCC